MQKQKKSEGKGMKLFDMILYLVIAVCAVGLVAVVLTRRTTENPLEVPIPDFAEDSAEVTDEPEKPEEKETLEPEPEPVLTWADAEEKPLGHGLIVDGDGMTSFFYDGRALSHTMDGTWVLGDRSEDGAVTVAHSSGVYTLLMKEQVWHIEGAVRAAWLSRDGATFWYLDAGGTLIRMDLAAGETTIAAEGLLDDAFVVSPSGTAVVYQTEAGGWLWMDGEARALPEGFVGISVTDGAELLYGTMTDAETDAVMLYAYAPATDTLHLLGETENVDHYTNETHEELFFTDGKYTWYTPDGENVYQLGSYFLCEPVGELRFPVREGAAITVYVDTLQAAALRAVPRNTTLDMKAELYRLTAEYQPEQFANQVDFYSVQWIADAETVYYTKNGLVYRAERVTGYQPKQLASMAAAYCVSEDGELLVVLDTMGDLYAIHEDGALRIDRTVMGSCYIGGDGRTVYYEKAGAGANWQKDLYRCRVTEEPILMAEHMGGLIVEDGYVKYTVYLDDATETMVCGKTEGVLFSFRVEREA